MKPALLVLGALLVAGAPAAARAQDSTGLALARARQQYEQLELERALVQLRQIVSPQWAHPVTSAQRVEAYIYLGAALMLAGQRDSAVTSFGSALARDAFADLDPRQFTPAQMAAFVAARRRVFAVDARPVAAARADVRTERIHFTVATTHAAALQVRLQPSENGIAFPIYSGESEGVRDIAWDGLIPDGRLAPPGRYAVLVVGRSRVLAGADSTRVFFELAHEAPTLEDTLPELLSLPERAPIPGARLELAKGLAVAAGALLASQAVANRDLGGGQRGAAALVAGVAVSVGIAGFARRGPEIPENVAANARREVERRAANEAIAERNAARQRGMILVVTPAAGVGP